MHLLPVLIKLSVCVAGGTGVESRQYKIRCFLGPY